MKTTKSKHRIKSLTLLIYLIISPTILLAYNNFYLNNTNTAKTGKEVALVAYSPVKYAQLSDDAEALAKITELEQLLSKKTGKDVVLVAFSI